MSKITENILNLIFCVRQTHTVLTAGLVKSRSWPPIVHRIRSPAHSLAHVALWNPAPHLFSQADIVRDPGGAVAGPGAGCTAVSKTKHSSFQGACLLMRRTDPPPKTKHMDPNARNNHKLYTGYAKREEKRREETRQQTPRIGGQRMGEGRGKCLF